MASSSLLCQPYPSWTHRSPLSFRRRSPLAVRIPLRPPHLCCGALNPPPPFQEQEDDTIRAAEGSDEEHNDIVEEGGVEGWDVGWLPAFPHVLAASMSNFLFGYHIGVMNGPIEAIAQELGFDGNSFLQGLVVSIFIAGAFIGSISGAPLIDKLGSRRTLQIDTIPLILGALLSAQAHSWQEILCGRFLVGLGIGVNGVLVPLYISEVSPTRYRGSLGAICQIGTCIGIIAALSLGISSENDPHWWRTMLYIASVPGFVLIAGMEFAVESPRWLCKVGRLDEAKRVIGSVWGESEVESSIKDIQSVINNDGGNLSNSWFELLKEPHNRGPSYRSVSLWISHHTCIL